MKNSSLQIKENLYDVALDLLVIYTCMHVQLELINFLLLDSVMKSNI